MPVDWLAAEETLDDLGIGYLADPFELLQPDGRWLRVRLTEISSTEIRLKKDDWGAIDAPQVEFRVPFPIPHSLRPIEGDGRSRGGDDEGHHGEHAIHAVDVG
jgi:hypothetical protein